MLRSSAWFARTILSRQTPTLSSSAAAATASSATRLFTASSSSSSSSKSSTSSRPDVVADRPAKSATSESSSGSEVLHSLASLTDEEVVALVVKRSISQHKIEDELKKASLAGKDVDIERAVRIRRLYLREEMRAASKKNADVGQFTAAAGTGATSASEVDGDTLALDDASLFKGLPYKVFDYRNFYSQVLNKNCENVIGYVPIPVGFAGPLQMNGKAVWIPMATTEGALVASTNRGCRAITESGGCTSTVYNDGMTRAPVVRMVSAAQCVALKRFIEDADNFALMKAAFDSTSAYGRLLGVKVAIAGRNCHIRFKSETGDAMGMNMVSKGVLKSMDVLESAFPEMEFLGVSGNYCTDKKPSAINWVEGRGKSVVCEVELSRHVVINTLKCTVQSLIDLNTAKNLIGSSLAGSIGGNNAHASNIVTACFMATGQDVAQNIESSNCMTLMEPSADGKRLHVSVTMPIMEVATVGGGTALQPQRACLEMMGVAGAHALRPGANATELAKHICGAVLAGEINLMAALASHHLVSAHMKLGRSVADPGADRAAEGGAPAADMNERLKAADPEATV